MVTGKESNSQLHINLVSGFMNQGFDSGATARYTLFIFIGPQEIAGLVCNQTNLPLAGEHYNNVDITNESVLKKLFSHSDVFNHLFNQVHVYTLLPNEISTPIDWIESNEDENMLRHASGSQKDVSIHTFIDSRHKWIFGIPNAFHKLIKSTYNRISITPLLAQKNSFLTNNIAIYITGKNVVLFDNNENHAWKSTIAFDNEKSVLFALLSYTEIYNYKPEDISISLICDYETKEQITPTLLPYFKTITPLQTETTDNQDVESCLLQLLQKLTYAHH